MVGHSCCRCWVGVADSSALPSLFLACRSYYNYAVATIIMDSSVTFPLMCINETKMANNLSLTVNLNDYFYLHKLNVKKNPDLIINLEFMFVYMS